MCIHSEAAIGIVGVSDTYSMYTYNILLYLFSFIVFHIVFTRV